MSEFLDILLFRDVYGGIEIFGGVLAWIVVLLILCLVCLVVGWVCNELTAKWGPWFTVTVDGKSYTPSRTSTGVGPAVGGNGGVAVTTSYASECWIVMFKTKDGELIPFDSEEVYAAAKEGQTWRMRHKTGVFDVADTEVER